MKSYSLENQIGRKVVLLNSIIFLILIVFFNVIIDTWFEHELDETLEVKANILIGFVIDTPAGPEFDFSDVLMPEFDSSEEPKYFQIWIDGSGVFKKSNSLKNNDLSYIEMQVPGQIITNLDLMDGRRGRMIQIAFFPKIADEKNWTSEKLASQKLMILVLAGDREELDLIVNSVHVISILVTFLVLLFINYTVKATVRKSLYPLNKIKKQISLLDAENLNQRLILENSPTELIDVIDHFNKLLTRLDESFYREQRFSSDVAHELRTPIAEIRTMSEVALKWPNDAALTQNYYSGVLASCVQMQLLVNNLLALTRCEKGNIKLEFEEIDLGELVNECALHYQNEANIKHVNIIVNIPDGVVVSTSVIELEQIINNLLSNAVSYSCKNTHINVQLINVQPIKIQPIKIQPINIQSRAIENTSTNNLSIGSKWNLVVSNETDQLQEEDMLLLFDRLWRKSKSRSSNQHSGLGLSLVKAYAGLLGLKISAQLNNNIFSLSIGDIHVAQED